LIAFLAETPIAGGMLTALAATLTVFLWSSTRRDAAADQWTEDLQTLAGPLAALSDALARQCAHPASDPPA